MDSVCVCTSVYVYVYKGLEETKKNCSCKFSMVGYINIVLCALGTNFYKRREGRRREGKYQRRDGREREENEGDNKGERERLERDQENVCDLIELPL